MVYKRWKGKKVKPGDPHYDRARWWMEYRLNGRRIHQAIPEARTQAQAERAEVSEREAIYNRRYNRGRDIGFRDYYDEFYLPWLKEKKTSQVLDAESRVKKLKRVLWKPDAERHHETRCRTFSSDSTRQENTARDSAQGRDSQPLRLPVVGNFLAGNTRRSC